MNSINRPNPQINEIRTLGPSSSPSENRIIPPSNFRSWEEQQITNSASQSAHRPIQRRHMKLRFWQTRDFRVLAAITITAIIAIVVYQTTKSLG